MCIRDRAQRVSLVRAIINSPEVLFADEPTGALNSANTQKVLDIMTELNEKGQTIVLVTHDIKSARRANRVLYLKDGDITSELNLGKYTHDDKKRQEDLRKFLCENGW